MRQSDPGEVRLPQTDFQFTGQCLPMTVQFRLKDRFLVSQLRRQVAHQASLSVATVLHPFPGTGEKCFQPLYRRAFAIRKAGLCKSELIPVVVTRNFETEVFLGVEVVVERPLRHATFP